jgi:hypothetical protein
LGEQTQGTNTTLQYFPDYSNSLNYDTTKYFLGFVQPVEFENAPELDTTITIQGGASINVKGFDQQDQSQKLHMVWLKQSYQHLKYATTKPPIAPRLDKETDEAINKVSNLYEQSYDNTNTLKNLSNFYYPIKA